MKYLNTKVITSYIVFFIMLGIGYVILNYQIWSPTQHPVTYHINSDAQSESDMLSIRMEASKSWDDTYDTGEKCVGAQYDGFIINNSDKNFYNWTLDIQLPEAAKIDSSWNGTYVNEHSYITMSPIDDILTIEPGETASFGFVLHSDSLLTIQEFTIIGYQHIPLIQYPLFWVLIIATVFWCIAFICYLSFGIRIYRLQKQRQNDEAIILQSMQTFANLIDAKDPYTRGHSTRVAAYTRLLCKEMKLDSQTTKQFGYIALMHDCGKIEIPDEILNKPGALLEEERNIIKSHTVIGGNVLADFNAIDGISDGAMYHHERFDGKGYPSGLKGEDIPLCARIICVADSYDAMNSDRIYRNRLSKSDILKELRLNSGTQFDPQIVAHMIFLIEIGKA